MNKILVIDDEPGITSLIKRGLERENYTVITYNSCKDVNLSTLNDFNLIILDVMMPDVDGFAFCKQIRNIISCPILFLTAKTLEQDIIYGLAIGADDYITKPFSIKQLCARVNAHIRRENREHHSVLYISNVRFNLDEKAIYSEEEKIPLTKSEYAICEYLALNRGQVFSREQIFEQVFSFDKESNNITIAVHIKNIRTKLASRNIDVIKTVWGVGYKWE